ncbi:hypothetical protein [Natronoglomus mannanivorans]|uniref:Terminase-like family protein n=1 Tax=Natronoglomus mannanivorans TaxID=2979990 RepID=A0AAP2Z1N5_9EURY|nr:hypothetical protein [Halobacteria archaeon AArc-xg1-1]
MSALADVDPSKYTEGRDRYVNFAEDVLQLRLSREQKELLRALAEHQRVLIMSGNGPGKSFGVAIAKSAFLFTNLNSTVLGTSGSYSQYIDAVWRPMKTLHGEAKARVGLPGETYDGGQPTLEIDDDWFAKVVSPRDPGDLEGRHADSVLVVIEEADKKFITDEHFDSAGSSITDDNDRMIAICNPPKDETNPVAERLESDRWHTIQFSTLECHNVRVDAGELDEPKIPGITDLSTVIDDWEAWNDEPWPGLKEARRVSDSDSEDFREDLDERWYRRRAGIIPPAGAEAFRPFTREDVLDAWGRRDIARQVQSGHQAQATAVDVARSGDDTVASSVYDNVLKVRYEKQGTDHTEQAGRLRSILKDDAPHPIAVDAIGEGSGLEDLLAETFPTTIRFGAGSTPKAETKYYDCWAEGMHLFGQWLRNGGVIANRELREELLVAARILEFEEKHLASRGENGADVLKLTPKSEIKEVLGRSPDRMDSAYMTIWARDAEGDRRGVRSYYGDADGEASDWADTLASNSGVASYYDTDPDT